MDPVYQKQDEIGNAFLFWGKDQFVKAFKIFDKYKEEDSPVIHHYLGYMYRTGKGTEQDYEKAHYFYELAASKKFGISIRELALMYKHGHYVNKDFLKAKELCEQAIEYGYSKAQDVLDDLFKEAAELGIDITKLEQVKDGNEDNNSGDNTSFPNDNEDKTEGKTEDKTDDQILNEWSKRVPTVDEIRKQKRINFMEKCIKALEDLKYTTDERVFVHYSFIEDAEYVKPILEKIGYVCWTSSVYLYIKIIIN